MLNPIVQAVAHRFRCPECFAGPLTVDETRLQCGVCQASYAINDGVPMLLSRQGLAAKEQELKSETGTLMVGEYSEIGHHDTVQREKACKRFLSILRPPDVLYHPNPDMRKPPANQLFDHRGADTLILNVGGGPRRYSPRENCMNLDVFLNVNTVGDAHNIPYMDETFDSVFANAVLEHVYDHKKVASEMLRVLKPGGLFYAEVPFMFFFHGYPNDFQRLTREGIRRLAVGMDDVEVGVLCGVFSSMLMSMNIFLQMFIPARLPLLRKAFNGMYRWLFFPFKYLDIWMNKHPESHILAGGFYVIARKPAKL